MGDQGPLIREWVEAWGRAGPPLEAERRERVRRTDTARDLRAFTGMTRAALEASPPAQWSGLVEQQAWFQRVRQGP